MASRWGLQECIECEVIGGIHSGRGMTGQFSKQTRRARKERQADNTLDDGLLRDTRETRMKVGDVCAITNSNPRPGEKDNNRAGRRP